MTVAHVQICRQPQQVNVHEPWAPPLRYHRLASNCHPESRASISRLQPSNLGAELKHDGRLWGLRNLDCGLPLACPPLGVMKLSSSSRRGWSSGHHYIMGLAPVLRNTVIEESACAVSKGRGSMWRYRYHRFLELTPGKGSGATCHDGFMRRSVRTPPLPIPTVQVGLVDRNSGYAVIHDAAEACPTPQLPCQTRVVCALHPKLPLASTPLTVLTVPPKRPEARSNRQTLSPINNLPIS